jgi:hypothetical protein
MEAVSIEKGPKEVRLTLYVKDIDAAARNVEDILHQSGAAEIKNRVLKGQKIQSAFLSSKYLSRVIEKTEVHRRAKKAPKPCLSKKNPL